MIFHSAKAQQTYYVDQVSGNDLNNGTSLASPWKNLTKLYNLTLSPGSSILLKSGSVWTSQQLKFKGSGSAASSIIVNKYGTGANPVIHGNGLVGQGVVYLYNQQYIEINNLEITNSPNGPVNSDFFVGLYQNGNNPLGADRRGVMVVIDGYGTANHIYLKNLNIHHIKGQLGSGQTTVNGAIPKRTGGIYFTVLGNVETSSNNSRFNDILIDSCDINYCENVGLALDNEWNVYYPGGTEFTNWYNRRFTNIKVSNNIIHHIGKNAMIIRCTDETGLIEKNVCYETALGTTGNTMFTARAKNTVFQYNEGYFNRSTTQTVDPGNIDGCMYDPDFGSIGIIFQYSYSHDNSEGIYWGCNTRGANNNTTGIPDPQDTGCTLRYCISQNDKGDLVYFNYSSAGNEIYNNVFYIGPGLSPNIIHENSGNNHTYNFFNNIIYNLSSATNGADYAFGTDPNYIQNRNISHNIFYGNHHVTEPADLFKILSDPNFINPGSGTLGVNSLDGYKLLQESPAIASGRLINNNGGKDYFGNSVSSITNPNRGAFQGTSLSLPLPVINSFSPSIAVAGSAIIIKGTNFSGVNSITFGGTPANSFTLSGDTMITAVLGNGSSGKLIVNNSFGADTSDNNFVFCVRPNAPSASNTIICVGTSASLNATGTGTITWYNAASGGVKLATGNTFVTPLLQNSTTYYVQDSTCAASASRTAVVVSLYPTIGETTIQNACDSFIWYGNTYKTSGTYIEAHTNSNGCASPDTLILTISASTRNAQTVTNCGSYLWNGTTYSASGDYVYQYTNTLGCASADTLHLTISCPYSFDVPSNIDAGFENQTLGNLASGNPNTSATQWSFVLSGNGQVRTINATGGYGGPQFLSLGKLNPTSNTSTTANSNILSTNTFLANTKYIIQFYYKRNTGTPDPSSFVFISLNGTSAARDQTNIALGTPTNWTKYSQVVTTNATTTPTTSGVAGINIKLVGTANGSTSAVVDVDNFVVYAADDQSNPLPDTISPASPTGLTVIKSPRTINLNWNNPNTGTDGGKYMVVKYTSNPAAENAPFANAVYNTGNSLGTGTIIYIGNATGFADTGISNCNTYWYRVYTLDKAYNYALQPATISASLTTSSMQTVSVCGSYSWNGSTYSQSGIYNYTTTNSYGCDSTATLNLTITACPVNLAVSAFLEGYVLANGKMRPTLYLAGISSDSTAVDSVTLSLWHPQNLQSLQPDFQYKSVLNSDGNVSFVLPSALNGGTYYLAISHRNSVSVWSANPVLLGVNANYNFTLLQNCYNNGVSPPLKLLPTGSYGLYAGDVNQDGGIDLSDLQIIENQLSANNVGYNNTDCDGNLLIDTADRQLAENNAASFIYYARPF